MAELLLEERAEVEHHARAGAAGKTGDDDDAHAAGGIDAGAFDADRRDLTVGAADPFLDRVAVGEEREARELADLAGADLEIELLAGQRRLVPPIADLRMVDQTGADVALEVHLEVDALVLGETDRMVERAGLLLFGGRLLRVDVGVDRQVGDAFEVVESPEAL